MIKLRVTPRAEVQRYWINKIFCWHAKEHRTILMSRNGTVMYCGKCGRKVIGIHEFGTGDQAADD